MSYNPHARDKYYKNGELAHSRPFGSKNGVSNTPGYRPVGKKAVGVRQPDGTYIYPNMSASQRARNTERLNAAVNGRRTSAERTVNSLKLKSATNGNSANVNRGPASQRARQNANGQTGNFGKAVNTQKLGLAVTGKNAAAAVNKTTKKAKSAFDNVGNWLGDRARDTTNWINKRGDELRDTSKNIGNWFGQRGKELGETANKAGSAINKARVDAGNWLKDRGIELGDTAKKTGDWFGQRGKELGETANKVGKAVSDTANKDVDAVSNRDERANYQKAQQAYRMNPNAETRKALNEARDAYNNHLLTKVSRGATKAGRDVENYIKTAPENVKNYVKSAPGNVKKFIEDAPGNIKKTAKNARTNIRKTFSNEDEQNSYKLAREMFKNNPNQKTFNAMKKAERDYNNNFVGKAGDAVKSTANKAGKAVSESASNVANFAKSTASEATKTLKSVPSNLRNQANAFIDNIKSGKTQAEIQAAAIKYANWLNNTIGGGYRAPSDDFLDKLLGKK